MALKLINVGLAKFHKVAAMAVSGFFFVRLGALDTKFLYRFMAKRKNL